MINTRDKTMLIFLILLAVGYVVGIMVGIYLFFQKSLHQFFLILEAESTIERATGELVHLAGDMDENVNAFKLDDEASREAIEAPEAEEISTEE